jgi:DUF1365 family protein
MNSGIYHGSVRHRRFLPSPHAFQYSIFMMYLDLDEIPEVFDGNWLWSARRWAPAWFRRSDYLGDPTKPLAEEVRDLAEAETGVRPGGPIRMLTHLRYFGYIANPVTFYYCYDESGTAVETVLAEITNTPWKERHTYVLRCTGDRVHRFPKAFHVSPFMDMDHHYAWRFTQPGGRLGVHMENYVDGHKYFDASLILRRREITPAALTATLVQHPWMTTKVITAIYWQAARLWWKRTPFYTHPRKRVPCES